MTSFFLQTKLKKHKNNLMEQKTNREVINKPQKWNGKKLIVIPEADPKPSCISEKTALDWALCEAPGISVCRPEAVCNTPICWGTKALF